MVEFAFPSFIQGILRWARASLSWEGCCGGTCSEEPILERDIKTPDRTESGILLSLSLLSLIALAFA